MKRTVNVNIGSMAFTLNEDAYNVLGRYLNDIRSRIPEENADEIMDDIESRIADIFAEANSGRSRIVDLPLARKAMERMGAPDDFGAPPRKGLFGRDYLRDDDPYAPRKLYRSRHSNVIGGVCGGLADYFELDVSLVRVLFVLLLFLGGMSLWVYIILWIIIPLQPNYLYHDFGSRKRR